MSNRRNLSGYSAAAESFLLRACRCLDSARALTANAVTAFVILLFAAGNPLGGSQAHAAPAASTSASTSQPMRFAHYDRDDGLSQSAINQIVQDSSGFMWFATESGLNRFDGYDFTVSRRLRDDPRSLPNDFITDMAVDAAGDLWLSTDGGGLVRRRGNPIDMTVYRVDPEKPDSPGANNLRRTLADPRGWIWVGTMRDGLRRLDPASGKVDVYKHEAGNPASLSDNRVHALWLDADGSLWIGTGEGVDRLDPATGQLQRFGLGLEGGTGGDNRVLAIRRDNRGKLLVGTALHGLAVLDETSGDFEFFAQRRSRYAFAFQQPGGSDLRGFGGTPLGRHQ